MTGQFNATRPVSRHHHPAAESFAVVSMASSTGHWASYGRKWAHISDSVDFRPCAHSRKISGRSVHTRSGY